MNGYIRNSFLFNIIINNCITKYIGKTEPKQTLFFSRFYRYQVIWKTIEIIYKVDESLIQVTL